MSRYDEYLEAPYMKQGAEFMRCRKCHKRNDAQDCNNLQCPDCGGAVEEATCDYCGTPNDKDPYCSKGCYRAAM